jgi:hypothetical protein
MWFFGVSFPRIKAWLAAGLLATVTFTGAVNQVCGSDAPDDEKPAAEAKDADKPADGEDAPAPPAVKLGLNLNDARAFPGYTLLAPMGDTKTYLLDLEGRVVRTWDCGCTPALSAYLLENGNLLRAGTLGPGEQSFGAGPGAGGRIQEFTFDGEVVWDYKFPGDKLLPHHDICRLPNGNVLVIAWEKKNRDEAIAAGRAPENVGDGELRPDCLVEIKPTGKTTGEIVWEWHLWDHLVQDRDQAQANYGNVAEHPELVDVNFGEGMAKLLQNPDAVNDLAGIGYVGAPNPGGRPGRINPDWTHFNGIAYNADLDQIVISVHAFSEIWIIDHSTTTEEAKGHTGGRYGKGGDLLYRWGNPAAYRLGDENSQTLFSQHNAQWIDKGSPGAGNLLLFNNSHRSDDGNYSSVDEIVLPVDDNGNYQRPSGEAFGPKEPTWSYTAPKKSDLYSGFISGTQRLPNGNTLICSGANGTLTEVTPDKELVWKYVNPTKGNPFGGGGPGGFNMFGPPQIGKLLPSFAIDQLKLSDEQKKQIEEIEKEAQAKLDKIFNEEQRKQFAELQRNPFGGFPFGGPGGPGGGGPGGFQFGGPGGGPGGPGGGPGGPGGGPNFGPPGRDGGPQVAGGGPNFGPPGRGRDGGDGDRRDGGGRDGGRDGGGRRGRGRGGFGGGGPGGPGGPGGFMGGPPGGTSVFRAYRYAVDYPAFAGKDLTPGKTLVELVDEEEKAKNAAAKSTDETKTTAEAKDGERDGQDR